MLNQGTTSQLHTNSHDNEANAFAMRFRESGWLWKTSNTSINRRKILKLKVSNPGMNLGYGSYGLKWVNLMNSEIEASSPFSFQRMLTRNSTEPTVSKPKRSSNQTHPGHSSKSGSVWKPILTDRNGRQTSTLHSRMMSSEFPKHCYYVYKVDLQGSWNPEFRFQISILLHRLRTYCTSSSPLRCSALGCLEKNSWGALHRFQWWANQRRAQDTSRATVAWFGANFI